MVTREQLVAQLAAIAHRLSSRREIWRIIVAHDPDGEILETSHGRRTTVPVPVRVVRRIYRGSFIDTSPRDSRREPQKKETPND